MTKPALYSAMQPSADSLHLGNYVGALTNWITMQDEFRAVYAVANQHAITVPFEPAELRDRTRATAAQFIAAGIDADRSVLFVQSDVPAHAELTWVLSAITGFGEAGRMTQFKDKSQRHGTDAQNVGLFTYPILMAADILLYQTERVPVGEDQRQHVELTRDLAQRFNARYGETFTVPQAHIVKESAKVYDLQEPTAKMSKSAASDAGLLRVLDDPKVTSKKIMRAVTDADGEIRFDRETKPGVSNLLTIYSVLSGTPIDGLEREYQGRGYGDLKKGLAEVVQSVFAPIRDRANELLGDPAELDRLLARGAEQANELAEGTIADVYERVGFPRPTRRV
ncbi:tryptophan--tRNA ligase [Pseudoclavibacter endophyticus]|uniref:Tryptophan--tRNA ligase n=1 Tax=Pseudoclavibacter endophyticus TaxID=1778590 RepID=A0A6H9WQ70_9MICO|nr:tryptophan--tRNA ligase [Pseudoclavibacter endophyticus]KAB1648165.1 tryptophan--tRNA ligase [Pseudoclavibacter endophyticus]GGA70282.1 tryptophan--tRNA ligase [Pseudoclavibacter endophyticus]